jgi:integrase
LLRGFHSDWLFPGEAGDHKTLNMFSEQIGDTIFEATGLRITPHQFRHAAAAIFLKARPGEYELVRQLLGHRSIATTTRFYTGLDSLHATRLFAEVVRRELDERLPPKVSAARVRQASPGRQQQDREPHASFSYNREPAE